MDSSEPARRGHLDLLDATTFARLTARPGLLGELVPTGHRGWVVIDEVQRAPGLLDEVHRLIESRRLRFALTGSSARKLRRGRVNLLAGRALTRHMHPLTAAELGDDFDLPRAIRIGPALETLVLHHLRAWNDYGGHGCTIHYWRTPDGQEVDFVVYGKAGLWAIEVKRSARVRDEDLTGLARFRADYPMARALLLHAGTRRWHQSGIDLVPLTEALPDLDATLGLR